MHFGTVTAAQNRDRWDFTAKVHLGSRLAAMVQVELYADAVDGLSTVCEVMRPDGGSPGQTGSLIYRASVSSSRPSEHFTPRIVPYPPGARIPIEAPLIAWPGQTRPDG